MHLKTKHIFCLLIAIWIASFQSLDAKDTLHITSDKVARINKSKGTLVLEKNVFIIQESSQSTVKTDKLEVIRDTVSEQVVTAIADGNVKINYRPIAKPERKREITPVKAITSTCSWVGFDRRAGLIEMKGSVLIKSVDYLIEADHVKYYYDEEQGRMTALPGEQVIMTFYRDPAGKDVKKPSKFNRHKTRASADLVLINRAGRKMTLQGNVYVFDSQDQSQMSADRAELFFDSREQLERMIANGNFKMNQPKRISKADRAVFEYRTEEVTLIGNAYVKEEDQIEITSSQIIMFIETEKGIISGANKVPVKMKVEIE